MTVDSDREDDPMYLAAVAECMRTGKVVYANRDAAGESITVVDPHTPLPDSFPPKRNHDWIAIVLCACAMAVAVVVLTAVLVYASRHNP
jgi:hypothetical protein